MDRLGCLLMAIVPGVVMVLLIILTFPLLPGKFGINHVMAVIYFFVFYAVAHALSLWAITALPNWTFPKAFGIALMVYLLFGALWGAGSYGRHFVQTTVLIFALINSSAMAALTGYVSGSGGRNPDTSAPGSGQPGP